MQELWEYQNNFCRYLEGEKKRAWNVATIQLELGGSLLNFKNIS